MPRPSEPLRILFFPVGGEPELREIGIQLADYYAALGTKELAWYAFSAGGRWYSLVCDDEGIAKDRPPNRRLAPGMPYAGWVVRGAFLVVRMIGDQDWSMSDCDVEAVRLRFLALQAAA